MKSALEKPYTTASPLPSEYKAMGSSAFASTLVGDPQPPQGSIDEFLIHHAQQAPTTEPLYRDFGLEEDPRTLIGRMYSSTTEAVKSVAIIEDEPDDDKGETYPHGMSANEYQEYLPKLQNLKEAEDTSIGEVAVGMRVRARPGSAYTNEQGTEVFKPGDKGTVSRVTNGHVYIKWDRTGLSSGTTTSRLGVHFIMIEGVDHFLDEPERKALEKQVEVKRREMGTMQKESFEQRLQYLEYLMQLSQIPEATRSRSDESPMQALEYKGTQEGVEYKWTREGIEALQTQWATKKFNMVHLENPSVGGRLTEGARQFLISGGGPGTLEKYVRAGWLALEIVEAEQNLAVMGAEQNLAVMGERYYASGGYEMIQEAPDTARSLEEDCSMFHAKFIPMALGGGNDYREYQHHKGYFIDRSKIGQRQAQLTHQEKCHQVPFIYALAGIRQPEMPEDYWVRDTALWQETIKEKQIEAAAEKGEIQEAAGIEVPLMPLEPQIEAVTTMNRQAMFEHDKDMMRKDKEMKMLNETMHMRFHPMAMVNEGKGKGKGKDQGVWQRYGSNEWQGLARSPA
jgi:hypothetical protein